jgi:hypothetical protein
VQYSRKNYQTGEWQNQHIWLNIDELRDLADALDHLNEVGESPSSNIRKHSFASRSQL